VGRVDWPSGGWKGANASTGALQSRNGGRENSPSQVDNLIKGSIEEGSPAKERILGNERCREDQIDPGEEAYNYQALESSTDQHGRGVEILKSIRKKESVRRVQPKQRETFPN